MSIVAVLVVIAILAVVLYFLNGVEQMDAGIKKLLTLLIYCIIAVLLILFIASLFGYHAPIHLNR